MAVVLDNRYRRSFSDALSLARNRRDQATIYYSKDGVRAVYEVTTDYSARSNNTGLMIIRGQAVTTRDLPLGVIQDVSRMRVCRLEPGIVGSSNAPIAKSVFEHNGIDTHTGWDLRP